MELANREKAVQSYQSLCCHRMPLELRCEVFFLINEPVCKFELIQSFPNTLCVCVRARVRACVPCHISQLGTQNVSILLNT